MLSLSLESAVPGTKQVYCCSVDRHLNVAAGYSDGSVTLIKSGEPQKVMQLHKYNVTAVCLTEDYLISSGSDHNIVICDLHSGEILHRIVCHKAPVRCLRVSEDASLLFSGSGDQTVCVTSLLDNPPQVLRTLRQPESDAGMMSGLCVSPDNSLVVCTATSGTVFVYEGTSPKPRYCVYDAHEMGVNGCDMLQQGNGEHTLCTVGADYSVKLWEVTEEAMKLSQTLTGHTGQVMCVRFHTLPENTEVLVTGSVDKTVMIWDIGTGEKLLQSVCHSSFIYGVALYDDTLVTCSSDKTCKVWKVRSGRVRTINVIPLGNQEKLENWSPDQVRTWLDRWNLSPESLISATDLAHSDLSEVCERCGVGEETRERFERALSLLRSFQGVPHEFLCPISMEIMTDPVVATDGHSYERGNILEWLTAGHDTSPFTNTTLSTKSLVSNHNLRKLITAIFSP